jgi:hypothetical protein
LLGSREHFGRGCKAKDLCRRTKGVDAAKKIITSVSGGGLQFEFRERGKGSVQPALKVRGEIRA